MTLTRTQDYDLIREILTNPRVFKHISDDGSPNRLQYKPPVHEAFLYILVHDSTELLGLFMFHPVTSACVEVHTCLLPCAGMVRAKQAAKEMLAWIWENTKVHRVITCVPGYNQPALQLALATGFRAHGRNPKSFPKYGKLHDMILLGVSR